MALFGIAVEACVPGQPARRAACPAISSERRFVLSSCMNTLVTALIAQHRSDIGAACEKFGVSNLDLFGPAVAASFAPGSSDLDLAVRFRPEARRRIQDNYAGLHARLVELLGEHVDLVSYDAVSANLYRLKEIERSREPIYSAA